MVLILLSSDNVSSSVVVIKLSNCSLHTTLHCLGDFQFKPYVSVEWPEVRYSKRCASMTDRFEAMI